MREVEGIVVSIMEYKESDALVHVLNQEEGLITLYVRGYQKITSKTAPSIMPFVKATFLIEENDVKEILQLRSTTVKNFYRHIREDLSKQSCAICMCDYAKYASREMSDEVYTLLEDGLEYLENNSDPILVLLIYLSSLCKIFGIAPYVDGCVVCGEGKGICSVSVSEGGFICEECFEEGEKQDRNFLWLFRVINKAVYENIEKIQMNKDTKITVLEFLFDFILEHTSFVCKGRDFVVESLHL